MTTDIDPESRRDTPAPEVSSFEVDASSDEYKRRAYSGVLVVFSWNLLNLGIAFVGNVVLARLLTPYDFGVVAIGATAMLIVGAVAEGGLGAGLLRRPQFPSPAELRTMTGIQFTLMLGAAVIIAAAALPFGTTGQVVALMVFAMPIYSLQGATRVVLNRNLQLKTVTAIEAIAILASYTWSIGAVLAGAGVWGLASGWVVRSIVATLMVPFVPGGHLYRPTFEKWREFREIISFGIRFQANWVVIVLREQALNVVVAVVAGVSTLGLWSIGSRLLMVPNTLGEALGRVTFPTMAHALGQQRDVGPLVERTARLSATASALMLASFAASTPGLVPALFGSEWEDVVWIMPGACAGLMLLLPVAASCVGYLFAHNRPGSVLRASLLYAVGLIATTAALLPVLGIAAIGVGLLVAGVLEAVVLAPTVHRLAGARVLPPLVVPSLAAALGATAGWGVASTRTDFISGLAGGAVGGGLTLLVLAAVARRELLDLRDVLVKTVRGTAAAPTEAPLAQE
jgi:O-antigen/teichoic acid export membrane protein